MLDDMKANSSIKGKKKEVDVEVERIKALLFTDIVEEKSDDEAIQKNIAELFDFKPKTNTLKDWIARKNNFLK